MVKILFSPHEISIIGLFYVASQKESPNVICSHTPCKMRADLPGGGS